ncbi:MAG TPA: 4Fe-4S dicluster domain-containing protein, partial [Spirochaetota bacterium]|nr:4Fe-4S dicluster domain-containing protein [Spirochaetota bacterium]
MDLTTLYNLPAETITRLSFFNVGGPHGFMRWAIYLLMFIAFGYIIYTIYQRVKVWRVGKPELRTDFPEKRIMAVIKYVFLQGKIVREAYAGIMHAALFFGFVGLFIVTLLIMIQDDFTELFFHIKFLKGTPYLLWSLAGDLFGVVVIVGLVMAFYRRYKVKPSRLDTKPIDTFALVLIALIIFTGFMTEALRIAISAFPAFEVWSPVGYAMAYLFAWMSVPALETVHYLTWWVHVLGAFVFIGLVGSDKLGHILISSLNVYFQNLDNESAKTKFAMPVINPTEFETAESFGVGAVENFTWKQLMDGDACTRCGRCQDNCPAYLTEKPLSPKKIQNDVKAAMDYRVPMLMAAEDPAAVEDEKMLIGDFVTEDEIWACTNCAACMENCPVQLEHVPKINDMRRYKILMEGAMAGELQSSLTNMESNSNPYGFAFAARGDWVAAQGLDIKTIAEDPNVDFVYYVGCA